MKKSLQPIPKNAKRVFKGKIYSIFQWNQKIHDGSIEVYEKAKRLDVVTVIAITPQKEIIVIRDKQPGKKAILTLPGGAIKQHETLLEGAKRELLEETGYRPKKMKYVKSYMPTESLEWRKHIFIGKDCEKISNQKTDVGEIIKVYKYSLGKFIDLILKNNLHGDHVKTYIMENVIKEYLKNIILRPEKILNLGTK